MNLVLAVQEKRCPFWALAAPGVYLLAAIFAVYKVTIDRTDVGIFGILLAGGLLPAFVIPAIFAHRRARLEMTNDGVAIDGRLEKVDDAKIDRADRGTAVIHLVMRSGRTRSFNAPSYKDAQKLIAMLPPVSAPVGALTA